MAPAAPLPEELQAPGEAVCYINGKRHVLPPGRGEATLLQYLRGARRVTLPIRLLPPSREPVRDACPAPSLWS